MYRWTSWLFILGLFLLLIGLITPVVLGQSPMLVGTLVNQNAVVDTGAANFVTAVVLAFRGLDTLGELAILFTAATIVGLLLSDSRGSENVDQNPPEASDTGFILATGADIIFPLLLVFALYCILHGHLTPGGGFQGGAILASAFFLLSLAQTGAKIEHRLTAMIEGLAGGAFILLGLGGLFFSGHFMQPLLDKGVLGELFSAGSLPLLYLALGLKVGSELASLLSRLAGHE